jgi:hypothetical protein
MCFDKVQVSSLLGKTLVDVEGKVGGDQIHFISSDGSKWIMMHEQDCCEDVYIESIVGDLNDLIGSPILIAEEVSNSNDKPPKDREEYCESYTWTFYKFATVKGHVDIRWFGESNGYYSESVDFIQVK